MFSQEVANVSFAVKTMTNDYTANKYSSDISDNDAIDATSACKIYSNAIYICLYLDTFISIEVEPLQLFS